MEIQIIIEIWNITDSLLKSFYIPQAILWLDHLSITTDIVPRQSNDTNSKRGFKNAYFYRTHLLWNRLPLYIREIKRPSVFRVKLVEHIGAVFIRPFDTADPDESY